MTGSTYTNIMVTAAFISYTTINTNLGCSCGE